jgi:hypothetical protein
MKWFALGVLGLLATPSSAEILSSSANAMIQ